MQRRNLQVSSVQQARPVSTRKYRFQRFTSQLSGRSVDIGFSEANEVMLGRMAMVGSAALVANASQLGSFDALEQVHALTGLDDFQVQFIVACITAASTLSALSSPPVEVQSTRLDGPFQNPAISLLQPLKFVGVDQFGFNDSVELFHGRLAMLLMAACFF